jgi:hypothetical protein
MIPEAIDEYCPAERSRTFCLHPILAIATSFAESEAAMTGHTQHQFRIWHSVHFGELLFAFCCTLPSRAPADRPPAVSKPDRSPATRLSGRSGDEQPA